MKGYWLIIGTEVTDQQASIDYNEMWAPIAKHYGARLIRGDGAPVLLEGRVDTARVILAEFKDLATARACYEDPAYQEAKVKALQASKRDLLLIEADFG